MALSDTEIESVREMVADKTFTEVETLCDVMNLAQEDAMQLDVVEWESIKSKGLRMSGGQDGVDLDFDRNRRMLRDRVRRRLGLSGLGYAYLA